MTSPYPRPVEVQIRANTRPLVEALDTLSEAFGKVSEVLAEARDAFQQLDNAAESDGTTYVLTCAQCGTRTGELTESIHGPLCPQCAHRQNEHDEPGYGLAPSTYGFIDETE